MRNRVAQAAWIAALVVALVLAPAALAGKGRGGGNTGPTGSFSLVLLNSTDGLPHYGQDVTFNVTSNAYHPMVTLTCYQAGVSVKNQSVGFYPGWPWSQVFPLSSYRAWWSRGFGNAKLYYQTKRGDKILATMSFHVYVVRLEAVAIRGRPVPPSVSCARDRLLRPLRVVVDCDGGRLTLGDTRDELAVGGYTIRQ